LAKRRAGGGARPDLAGPDFTRRSAWRPPLIESRPPPRAAEIRHVGGFAAGDRVFHQKFGYGTIRAVEENKLSIDFDKAGDKKVMDSFVSRA
jgi:DNA helicase-2/ATP-dependent DNA helicase PcrA